VLGSKAMKSLIVTLAIFLPNLLLAIPSELSVADAKFEFSVQPEHHLVSITSTVASEIQIFRADHDSRVLIVDLFDVPRADRRGLKADDNPWGIEKIDFVQIGSKLRAMIHFEDKAIPKSWQVGGSAAQIKVGMLKPPVLEQSQEQLSKEAQQMLSDSQTQVSPPPTDSDPIDPALTTLPAMLPEEPQISAALIDSLEGTRLLPEESLSVSQETITKSTTFHFDVETLEPQSNLLLSIEFDKSEQATLKFVLSKSSPFKLVKSGANHYTLRIDGFKLSDEKVGLPYFAPQDFDGVSALKANYSDGGITIDIYTDNEVRITPFSRDEVIFLRVG